MVSLFLMFVQNNTHQQVLRDGKATHSSLSNLALSRQGQHICRYKAKSNSLGADQKGII